MNTLETILGTILWMTADCMYRVRYGKWPVHPEFSKIVEFPLKDVYRMEIKL